MELLEACEKGEFDRASQLIRDGCDPNSSKDGNGWTPLHWACWWGNLKFARTLVEDHTCDPECKTTDNRSDSNLVAGTTPLHLACRNGCTDVITFLLREVHCNPNCTTDDGDTPLSLTDETQTVIIRELLRHGADPKNDYARYGKYLPSGCPAQAIEPSVAIVVVGDHGTGKSTLVKALKTQARSTGHKLRLPTHQVAIASGVSQQTTFKAAHQIESEQFGHITLPDSAKRTGRKLHLPTRQVAKASGVNQQTAFITAHQIESEQFGHTTLYVFAGHKEFYSGHDSFVRNVVTGSSAAFLLVTDLRKSNKKFEESIMYWLNFINKRCSSLDTKPHIIIIGSHADELKPKEEKSKSKIVTSLKFGREFSSLHFIGYVEMNSCSAKSSAMTSLCRYLQASCKVLRSEEQMGIRTHCFYVFLRDKFHHSPAIELSTVHHTIGKKSASDDVQLLDFVPNTYSSLCASCEELNKRGHILFLKNTDNIENSWIVPDMSVLLSYVTGPVSFKEYQKDLATSTGVVPFSKMASYFPNLDPGMISQFLCRFEFCQEITDPEVLKVLRMSHSSLPTSRASPPPDEKFFFFPTLISIKAPERVWEPGSQYAYYCGWLLQCSQSKHFLTPRFLRALLIRLAFSAMVPSFPESQPDHPAIQRKCTFWMNGLYWAHRIGVEVVVVVDNLRTVTVLLRCLKRQEIDCIQFRSAIIRKVIEAKEEFCPEVSTSEYFILPDDAIQYPLKAQSELSLMSSTEVATSIATGKPGAFDINGKMWSIETLLHYEPYANIGETILRELFDENSPSYIQPVTDDFLNQIARYAHINHATELLARMLRPKDPYLSDTIQETIRTLHVWRSQNYGTYQVLRRRLDKFSVFAGRNPLEMAIDCPQLLDLSWSYPQQLSYAPAPSTPYTAQVFYEGKDTNVWMVHFVIVKNNQEFKRVVTQNYTSRNAELGPELGVEFEEDVIELDIPIEGTILENEWNITPLSFPMITKEEVDCYSPGQRIPSCQLQMKWTGSGDMPKLAHLIKLLGAEPPSNFITVHIWKDVAPRPPTPPPRNHSLQKMRRRQERLTIPFPGIHKAISSPNVSIDSTRPSPVPHCDRQQRRASLSGAQTELMKLKTADEQLKQITVGNMTGTQLVVSSSTHRGRYLGREDEGAGSTSSRCESPLSRGESPLSRGESSLSRGESPLSRGESPLSRGESPLSRGESLLSRGESPLSRGESPLSRGESPLSRGESPLSRGESPLSRGDYTRLRGDFLLSLDGEHGEGKKEQEVPELQTLVNKPQSIRGTAPDKVTKLQWEPEKKQQELEWEIEKQEMRLRMIHTEEENRKLKILLERIQSEQDEEREAKPETLKEFSHDVEGKSTPYVDEGILRQK